MIIAYYPGAGGNRYLQRQLGNNWNQHGKSYDASNSDQRLEYRYIITSVQPTQSPHVLTHCMNSDLIQQRLPAMPVVFIKSNLQASLRREWLLHGHERYLSKNIKRTESRLEHYNAIKDASWPTIQTQDQIDQLPPRILHEVNSDYAQMINCDHNVPGLLATLTQNLIDKINSAYEIICWHQDYYERYPVDFSAADQVIDLDNEHDEFAVLMRQELNLYPSEIFDQVWSAINEQ